MNLSESLSDVCRILREEKMPFAVIGGLAASARGEARFTRDVDVAVAVADDSEAEDCVFQFTTRGYEVVSTVEHDVTGRLATARTRRPSGFICDLVFSTCGIEK